MYKILIKYNSKSLKTFWYEYEIVDEDNIKTTFETSDVNILKEEMKKLIHKYGHENLKIINDVAYDVGVNITNNNTSDETFTTEEVNNIYNMAYNNVFEEGNNE